MSVRKDIVHGSTKSVTTDANGSIINDGSNQYAYDVRGRLAQTTAAMARAI